MKTKTKSKNDLLAQIGRIYDNFKDHRLYNRARAFMIIYNYNMSMTVTNYRLRREYTDCHDSSGKIRPGMEQKAKELLSMMFNTQYPRTVYTAFPKRKSSYRFDLES